MSNHRPKRERFEMHLLLFDGIVSAVEARVGQTVEREQVLITIQPGQAT